MSTTSHKYDPNVIINGQDSPDRPQKVPGTIGEPYGEKYFSIEIHYFGAKYFTSFRIFALLARDLLTLPEPFVMSFQIFFA